MFSSFPVLPRAAGSAPSPAGRMPAATNAAWLARSCMLIGSPTHHYHTMNLRFSQTIVAALFLFTFPGAGRADEMDSLLPIRGFCIAAPRPNELDAFVAFVSKELAPRHVNTLVLRVDYNYQYESYPKLRDRDALSKADVKKLVEACRAKNIHLIPQVNLLGHQSWAKTTYGLLREFPEFD